MRDSVNAPISFAALERSGEECAQQGNWKKALDCFKQALEIDPAETANHINLSNIYLKLNEVDLALQHLHQVLRVDPNHLQALNNLGRLFYKQGRVAEALPLFEKALRVYPSFWEAHYNLAHTLASLNQMTRAATHYQEVLKIIPNHSTAHFNLGLIYQDEKEYLLAEVHLRQALRLNQEPIESARRLGKVCLNLGNFEEALEVFTQALTLDPALPDVHHNLAILHLNRGEKSKALEHFQQAFTLDSSNETAQHMINALAGSKEASSAPNDYIKLLFDQYADYYDEHLKVKLKYQAPGLLRSAFGQCLSQTQKALRVLDLGCGTGLCGLMFRDVALEMTGVDLSEKMIEKAKDLGAYDKLIVSDLNSFVLELEAGAFELIIASDVFVYSGDLSAIFSAVKKALSTPGFFAFTIEKTIQKPFVLLPTGRFAHSELYIKQLAENHHFSIEIEEEILLRENGELPILGQLFVLKG